MTQHYDVIVIGSGPGGASVAHRLARTHPVPQELLAVIDGPLANAITDAAAYANDAINEATREAYHDDWQEFAAWCRTQRIDPTVLPIHPVLVAAYLASPRRLPFNQDGIFRHYPELDLPAS